MKGIASKTKTILILAGFIIFAAAMFLFGYGIMATRNQATADEVAKHRIDLEALQQEQKSFENGKKDLAQLKVATYPPDELFSSDTKVVKEIQQLEEAAQRYDLDLDIAVVGQTKDALPVPGTGSGLIAIPYNMTLTGSFSNILLFQQTIERLPFATHTTQLSVTVSGPDTTRAVLSSEFYIKK